MRHYEAEDRQGPREHTGEDKSGPGNQGEAEGQEGCVDAGYAVIRDLFDVRGWYGGAMEGVRAT